MKNSVVRLIMIAVTVVVTAAALPAAAAPPALPAAAAPPAVLLLDDFQDIGSWSAYAADGVEIDLAQDEGRDGPSLRIDFRFRKGGGYAVFRKEFGIDLPDDYMFTFAMRGEAPSNHLEFKLIDSTGENVWWNVRRDMNFPETWETFRIKRRHIQFAWGPRGGGEIEHVHAIEFAITAGSGGEGSVWIDDLTLTTLPPAGTDPPAVQATASSSSSGHSPAMAHDNDTTTSWSCGSSDNRPWIAFDLGGMREYGGLTVDWAQGRDASDYAVEISEDGESWRAIREVLGGNGGRDQIYLPETESAHLRLALSRAGNDDGIVLREVTIRPLEWSASREDFFQAIADDYPRGTYPRAITGEASYWTVVGVDRDTEEGLLNEDGMLETGKGGFSVEPFLWVDGRLIGWADVRAEQSLLEGSLPIPTVKWRAEKFELEVTAFGTGPPGSSSAIARYRVKNGSFAPREFNLYLAIRPFQVNPPYQSLNMAGGTARIETIETENHHTIIVNGDRRVVSLSTPTAFGAATFDQGDIVADFLGEGRLPETTEAVDPFGAASGALAYRFDLPAGGSGEAALVIPLHEQSVLPENGPETWPKSWVREQLHEFSDLPEILGEPSPASWWVEEELKETGIEWNEKLGRVSVILPGFGGEMTRTLKSQLGYILVNRSGPAIQPGTRSYDRSWIRDGALTSSALLRMGHPEPVRDFIEWFATYQYDNGKVPCCVDDRGSDPVDEHDSAGEFIFLIAEYYRYTGDRSLLERMWPRVESAAAYLDSLRALRRTGEYRAPDKKVFFGLLPPSISHEGYSAKPMHSYWDDLFALRGFRDASIIAGVLGHDDAQKELTAIRDEFETDLIASLEAAMELHEIDYLPGCADLGDFDATSTTIALDPVGAGHTLPQAALRRTFEKYYEFFVDRRESGEWEAFTPYEMRNIGAFIRLGWRERALELVDYFLAYRRPSGWKQWAEVVWKDERKPEFIGDMPHTWVGSDFIRSVLDMLVYASEERESLVLCAGVPMEWLLKPAGVGVRNLPTPYGPISFSTIQAISPSPDDMFLMKIGGSLRMPPGGIELRLPFDDELIKSIAVNKIETAPDATGAIVLHELPAHLMIYLKNRPGETD